MKKTQVGSRELKTRLGTYLRQVQKGRIIVVTDRGRPVAELRQIAEQGNGEQSRLDQLMALGLVTRKSTAALAKLKPQQMPGKPLSVAVLEGREDRL